MIGSSHRSLRLLALCGVLIVVPTLADARDRFEGGSESGFGSGAVFVGKGGEVSRGLRFGFGEGRGVAVVSGPHRGSFERYSNGRRFDPPRPFYRAGGGPRGEIGAIVVLENPGRARDTRAVYRARLEERRRDAGAGRQLQSDGSFIRLRDSGRIDRFESDPRYDGRRIYEPGYYRGNGTLTTFDEGDWGGGRGGYGGFGVVYPAMVEVAPVTISGSVGPRIIDVETERLDRRAIDPSGLDVVTTGGGAKIIRVAPGYRMARAEEPSRPAARPARSERQSRNEGGLGLQPWSPGWLRYCQRTQPSFDPELGTYVTTSGRVRFCTAE